MQQHLQESVKTLSSGETTKQSLLVTDNPEKGMQGQERTRQSTCKGPQRPCLLVQHRQCHLSSTCMPFSVQNKAGRCQKHTCRAP